MEQQTLNSWSVWIDENKKVISIKENPAGKEIFFDNRDIGIKAITGACEVFSVNLPFCGKKVCFQGRAFKACPNYNIS